MLPEPCTCTLEWDPQCGTDGVSYGNPCAMSCAKKEDPGKENLEIAYSGQCQKSECQVF